MSKIKTMKISERES